MKNSAVPTIPPTIPPTLSARLRVLLALPVLAVVSACAPAPVAEGISDPNEAANRRIFAFNTRVDQKLFAGAARREDASPRPAPLRRRVRDFAANTALPSVIVNGLLQGRAEDAVHNTVRLLFNTTIGLGGLFDIATGIGLEERSTDFGETLHVWGVAEGDYVMLPLIGPSTERDALGIAVDFFTNPLTYALAPPARYWPPLAGPVTWASDRLSYGSSIEDLLSNSEDPYATVRLFYLDSRRYDLSGGESGDDLYDIYEEAYE